jgi:hypothetical protein
LQQKGVEFYGTKFMPPSISGDPFFLFSTTIHLTKIKHIKNGRIGKGTCMTDQWVGIGILNLISSSASMAAHGALGPFTRLFANATTSPPHICASSPLRFPLNAENQFD